MDWDQRNPLDGSRLEPRFENAEAQGRSLTRARPRWTKWIGQPLGSYVILALCLVAYAVFNLGLGQVPELLMVDAQSGRLFPGLITHMFLHANSGHLISNMLVLYFFGTFVERGYGTPRYLVLYFGAGILAALVQGLAVPGPSLGASGALSGVMAAFIRHFPRVRIYLYFFLPMPAWVFGVLWILFNLIGAMHGINFNIAFTAHLVGFISGLILSLILYPPGRPLNPA